MISKHLECQDRIMVVEDDPVNSKIIQSMLEKAGFSVCTVHSGRQCLQTVGDICPDLILMDIMMPDIGGIETCIRIKNETGTQNTPVIFVTASTDDHTLAKAFDAGASDYVRKPISRIELLARIRSALNQRKALLKLAEEEKLRGVLATAGAVCHELNQPLQYVMGAVQIILMDLDPDDPNYAHLDAIRARTEQMGAITRKLADVACYRTRKYAGGIDIIDMDRCSDKNIK
jgi:CheY-like chemotaxis protein